MEVLSKRTSFVAAVFGSTHKYIRGSLLSLVSPSAIKDRLLPKIDKLMRIHLNNWDAETIDIKERTNNMVFFILFNQIVEVESSSIYEAFKQEFNKLFLGAFSLPINIPGTNYYDGLQGRKNMSRILRQIIEKRKVSSITHNDMPNSLLRTEDPKYKLSDEEIIDQVISIPYAGYEAVSTTTMMVIKYLHDHPKALQELRDEHFTIQEKKKAEHPIDWNDFKSMSFTRAVIFETMRLASVTNFVLRRANEEIELNGFVIPKGWKIYVEAREINYDPILYPEPFTFNPWRWLENKSLESNNCCFFFGRGNRLCLGKDLSIVIISTFLHYFVTRFGWEEVGVQKIVQFPKVKAPNGLHVRLFKY